MEMQGATAGSGGVSNSVAAAGAAPMGSTNTQVNVSGDGHVGTASQNTGAVAQEWTKGLTPELQEYATQKGFLDTRAVIESYRNLEKLRGVPQERLLKLPEANDAPEWNEVYTKLGKPAGPDGYKIDPADPNDPSFTNWAKDTFHKLNLTSQQGQELFKQFNEYSAKIEEQESFQYKAQVEEQTSKLQKEWGAAYAQNLSRAQAAYRTFGIPDAAVDAMEKAIGVDGTMKLMLDLGKRLGEHGYISGDSGQPMGDNVMLAPQQAQAKIKMLKQDQGWTERYLKGGAKERAELERLNKMAYPTD